MEEIKVLELFGGIGAIRKAFIRQHIPFKVVDYVEIDKYAVASYNAIFNENYGPQDITEWNKDIKVDFIMHGSPCQDFSVAGLQQGGDEGTGTRSSLMWETVRIINQVKPKYVLWENVKNVISKKHRHNFDKYIDALGNMGYNSYYQVLNAKDYGIPQNRERVFTLSIRKDIDNVFIFPDKEPLNLKLKDMLEDKVDEKYYLSNEIIDKLTIKLTDEYYGADFRYDEGIRIRKNGLSPCLTTKTGTASLSGNTFVIKNNTKKGYLLAKDGDGVYTEPSTTKRGMVQDGITQTITQRQNVGVVVNERNKGYR